MGIFLKRIIVFITFFLLFFIQFNISKSAEKKKYEDSEVRQKLYEKLNWKNFDNPKKHILKLEKAKANIDILESEYYLDNWKDINQYSWWTWGYGTPEDEVLMVVGEDYVIYVSWKDEGYVKLDDWKNVDSNVLLKEMKTVQKENKKILLGQGLSYVTNLEWIYEPTLKDQQKVVSYSYKVTWSDGNITMESKNLKLGKKGYLESQFVNTIDENTDFKGTAEYASEFAEYITFDENFRHSDYKSGDKVAALGIGGLVAGTLGVKTLAKAGAFAKLIPLIAKFWWVLLAPIAAIGFFKKKSSNTQSTETKPKKRKTVRKKTD